MRRTMGLAVFLLVFALLTGAARALVVDIDKSAVAPSAPFAWPSRLIGPSARPSAAPTPAATETPPGTAIAEGSAPSAEPTSAPTATPTSAPTATPTSAPTTEPTSAPTTEPTSAPSATPTSAPSADGKAGGTTGADAETDKGTGADGTVPATETAKGTNAGETAPATETAKGTGADETVPTAETNKGTGADGTVPVAETDKGTVPTTETDKETVPATETDKGTAPAAETDKGTAPAAETDKGTGADETAPTAATSEENALPVLLVYRTPEENERLTRFLVSFQVAVEAVEEHDYTADMLAGRAHLVTTSCLPLEDAKAAGLRPLCLGGDFADDGAVTFARIRDASVEIAVEGYASARQFAKEATVLNGTSGERFGALTVRGETRPFATLAAEAIYVPYYTLDDAGIITLGTLMRRYLQSDSGRMYLLIDEIYPFSDLGALCDAADALYDCALPFIVRVMPVYDNLDYPAFKRYAQVLRYVQSRNGSIVVHDPIVVANEAESETIETKLARFQAALVRENIAAFPMPHTPYAISLDMLRLMDSEQKRFGAFPFDCMVDLGLPADGETLKSEIDLLNSRWLSVNDYKRRYTDEVYAYHEISIDARYTYIVEEEASLTDFFTAGNDALTYIVLAILLVFSALLATGVVLYRRKFYR